MTPTPIPFIESLRRDANGFANVLSLLTMILVVAYLASTAGHWIGWWGAPSMLLAGSTRTVIYFWLAFRAVCAVVDYALYAGARAATELAAEIVGAGVDSVREHMFPETPPAAPADDSERSFFTDALARSRQPDFDPETPPTAA